MADFMTVLAASQKQASTGPQVNALATLLPGGLFESVLSAQIGAATDGAAMLLPSSLPQASSDGSSLSTAPATKKPVLPAAENADLSASLPIASLPLAPLEMTKEPVSTMPAESAKAATKPVLSVAADTELSAASPVASPLIASLPVASPPLASPPLASPPLASPPLASLPLAPLEMTKEPVSDKTTALAEATAKPMHPAIQSLLEMAATPAAPVHGAGQDLPLDDRQLQVIAAAGSASTAVAGTLPPEVAVEAPKQSGQGGDLSDPLAMRQIGHFEQLARAPETRVQAAIEAPVRSQGFPAEFSEKIVWLAGRQSQVADLSLNPPHLGSLEVRLSLSGGEAGAQFYSPHPVVRDAIEAALPRLRELMAQAGIALGDAQVRDEAFARQEAGGHARAGTESFTGEALATLAPAGAGAVRAGHGLVDLYV